MELIDIVDENNKLTGQVAEVKYVEIEDIEIAQKNNDLNYIFSNWEEAEAEKFLASLLLI